LLDCEPKTGRQHQIRVHLAYIGHPVIGDKLYSGHEDLFLDYIKRGRMDEAAIARLGAARHALHSRYLKFFHPTLQKFIEIESPLPPDMEALI
jgi:23S rRNA pseudouridine1911/1915/1917 synthase